MQKTKTLSSISQFFVVLASFTLFSSTSFADNHAKSEANHTPLDQVLDMQEQAAKDRYEFRNPQETLDFFGVRPGMTVVEVLPGGGWYTKILLPYLGSEGKLIGVDYAFSIWPNFPWMTPERIEEKKTWVADWTKDAKEWKAGPSADISAFQFDEMPEEMKGTADRVLFIRALHNLGRLRDKGFLDSALEQAYDILKPGGMVGIVQHQALEDRPDEWANGSNGYLKKSDVKEFMKKTGFEYVDESSINENPNDMAKEGEFVWRLPPVLFGTKDDEEKKKAALAIGESNRMTMLFKKPSE